MSLISSRKAITLILSLYYVAYALKKLHSVISLLQMDKLRLRQENGYSHISAYIY